MLKAEKRRQCYPKWLQPEKPEAESEGEMGNREKSCQWNWDHLLFWFCAPLREDLSYYISAEEQSQKCLDLD